MSMKRQIVRNIREKATGLRHDPKRREQMTYQGRRPIERKRPIHWVMRHHPRPAA